MDQLTFVKAGLKPKYWYIQIAANSTRQYTINIKLLTEINFIIGITSYLSGIGPNNTSIINDVDIKNYFLTLKAKNSEDVFSNMRFDIFSTPAIVSGDENPANRFFPVNIKGMNIDLQNSYISNPGAASNALMLGFLYI